MEAKLEELKNFMSTEKEKRKADSGKNSASRWRSGTTKYGNSKYAELVIGHNPKPKPPAEPKPSSRGSNRPTAGSEFRLTDLPTEAPKSTIGANIQRAQENRSAEKQEVMNFLQTVRCE